MTIFSLKKNPLPPATHCNATSNSTYIAYTKVVSDFVQHLDPTNYRSVSAPPQNAKNATSPLLVIPARAYIQPCPNPCWSPAFVLIAPPGKNKNAFDSCLTGFPANNSACLPPQRSVLDSLLKQPTRPNPHHSSRSSRLYRTTPQLPFPSNYIHTDSSSR